MSVINCCFWQRFGLHLFDIVVLYPLAISSHQALHYFPDSLSSPSPHPRQSPLDIFQAGLCFQNLTAPREPLSVEWLCPGMDQIQNPMGNLGIAPWVVGRLQEYRVHFRVSVLESQEIQSVLLTDSRSGGRRVTRVQAGAGPVPEL